MVSKLKTASCSHIESIIEIQLPVFCEQCGQPTTKVSECERMINTYYMKGITIEPTGNSEKSEPKMAFEPTTRCDLGRML